MFAAQSLVSPFKGLARSALGALAGLTLMVSGMAQGASAAVPGTNEAATDFMRSFSDRAVQVLSDGTLDKDARQEALGRFLREGFDLEAISRFVLGRHWRSASPEELAEFRRLFEAFIISLYATQLDNYGGETLDVGAARQLDPEIISVSSRIVRPTAEDVQVDWRLRQVEAQWRIVDVVVEGVSLAVVQRQEFASVIRTSGGMAGLLEVLRQKMR